jgi:hypothetical protein
MSKTKATKKREPPKDVTYPEPSEEDAWSFTYFVLGQEKKKFNTLYHQKEMVEAIYRAVNTVLERWKNDSGDVS